MSSQPCPTRSPELRAGAVVALSGKPATAVVSDSGGLSSWRRVVAASRLDASPAGRACGVTALTAVAFAPSGELLVGASCSHPGEVGVLEDSASGWRTAGPLLPSASMTAMTSVLRLRSFEGGVSALIATYSRAGTKLLGARLTGDSDWTRPLALALGRTERLRATGISADGGLVVLMSGSAGNAVDVLPAGARTWTELPRPPARTEAISFEPQGGIDAFAVDRSQLTIYRLMATRSSWQRAQVIEVPIQYGSSS